MEKESGKYRLQTPAPASGSRVQTMEMVRAETQQVNRNVAAGTETKSRPNKLNDGFFKSVNKREREDGEKKKGRGKIYRTKCWRGCKANEILVLLLIRA